jgi:hypothetical protein
LNQKKNAKASQAADPAAAVGSNADNDDTKENKDRREFFFFFLFLLQFECFSVICWGFCTDLRQQLWFWIWRRVRSDGSSILGAIWSFNVCLLCPRVIELLI